MPANHDSNMRKGAHTGVTGSNHSRGMDVSSYVVHKTKNVAKRLRRKMQRLNVSRIKYKFLSPELKTAA
jgi:hypothetical protein